MRKLDPPGNDPLDVYDTCVNAIAGEALRLHYSSGRPQIAQAVGAFDTASQTASWATLPRVPNGNPGALIGGVLTKQNMMDLYSTYMVGADGPSRKIYDELLVGSGGICPFCGGLGHVHTLDHYLPKANYPAYSVLPSNLIPSCRDCNTGKGTHFAQQMDEQTLHPYLDDIKYFQQRWVSAIVSPSDPILVSFVCSPPNAWNETERSRVLRHFECYDLAYRFSVQAGAELARLIDLRSNSLGTLSPEGFRSYLLDCANSDDFDLNGWSRTMYAALGDTVWFREVDFTDPNWADSVPA